MHTAGFLVAVRVAMNVFSSQPHMNVTILPEIHAICGQSWRYQMIMISRLAKDTMTGRWGGLRQGKIARWMNITPQRQTRFEKLVKPKANRLLRVTLVHIVLLMIPIIPTMLSSGWVSPGRQQRTTKLILVLRSLLSPKVTGCAEVSGWRS